MSWLRSQKPSKRTGRNFKRFIEEVILPNELSYSKCTIAHSTYCNRFNYILFEITVIDKNRGSIYLDGHERSDVVAYRERFCQRWFDRYLPRIESYEGTKMV